jgi:hypothetical protein
MSYQTLKAEIDTEGHVHILEPVILKRKSQAIVTILEESQDLSHNILNFAGTIPKEDLEKMEQAIEMCCERIDKND